MEQNMLQNISVLRGHLAILLDCHQLINAQVVQLVCSVMLKEPLLHQDFVLRVMFVLVELFLQHQLITPLEDFVQKEDIVMLALVLVLLVHEGHLTQCWVL